MYSKPPPPKWSFCTEYIKQKQENADAAIRTGMNSGPWFQTPLLPLRLSPLFFFNFLFCLFCPPVLSRFSVLLFFQPSAPSWGCVARFFPQGANKRSDITGLLITSTLKPGGGKQQLEYQSVVTQSPQRNYHSSLAVNPPQGLGLTWYLLKHIPSNSSQILLVLLMSYFTIRPQWI